MPPGWEYAIAFTGAIALVAAAMVVFWTRRARRAPIDDMLDVIGEEGPPPGCDCEDCEVERELAMDEFELRAHMAYDRYRFRYKAPGERP